MDDYEGNIEHELERIQQCQLDGRGDCKPWWRSKIILVNLAALAFGALEAGLGVLQGHIPGGLYVWLLVGLPIINIGLRFATRLGVRLW
jgi:hypothetical protein